MDSLTFSPDINSERSIIPLPHCKDELKMIMTGKAPVFVFCTSIPDTIPVIKEKTGSQVTQVPVLPRAAASIATRMNPKTRVPTRRAKTPVPWNLLGPWENGMMRWMWVKMEDLGDHRWKCLV